MAVTGRNGGVCSSCSWQQRCGTLQAPPLVPAGKGAAKLHLSAASFGFLERFSCADQDLCFLRKSTTLPV